MTTSMRIRVLDGTVLRDPTTKARLTAGEHTVVGHATYWRQCERDAQRDGFGVEILDDGTAKPAPKRAAKAPTKPATDVAKEG